jgi:predicted ATPase/class 3 adenylate cyclase
LDALPSGVVTFCFTDIEASTPLLAKLGANAYQNLLEIHRRLIRTAAGSHGGVEVRTEGDGFFFAFSSAREAVLGCCEAQQALVGHSWPPNCEIKVRIGLHTGEGAVTSDQDYLGLAVHHAARVMTAAHGGQVLASGDVLADLTDLDQMEFRDLGEFALRGFEGPTQLYQLCHPELPSDFPPPRAPSAGVHNLGAQRSSFVGRDNELARLSELLERNSLVTIVGPGGIGKTRLAVEACLRAVGGYPAGVWLVSLVGVNDARLLSSTVASALGVSDRAQRGLEEAVIDQLCRGATLLIMDNCEHVAEGCAEHVARWLRVCPELTVLATGRRGLSLPEEYVLRLSSLSETAALTLFAQRAAQARGGFSVTAANSVAVGRICRQLDGVPLALELAAARLASFSPAQVADRLADTISVLDVRRSDADVRHRTLRAALDWSYELLHEEGRNAIRRLAVFRGGFTASAAEEVAGVTWDILDDFVTQSLVEVDPDLEENRFHLLEPVRQYAWGLASAAEHETTQKSHATWVVGLAKQTRSQIVINQAEWTERLEAEHANIEAAVNWSLSTPDDDSALRIAGYLGYYWFTTGHGEAIVWIEQALARSDHAAPRLRTAALLAGATLLQLRPLDPREGGTTGPESKDFERSARWARQAAEIYRETGSRGGVAWALFWETRALDQFDEPSARKSIAEALALFRELGEPLGICWCLEWVALFACRDRRWPEAEALYKESLELGRATGVDHAVGDALGELGRLAARSGDHERAVELAGESVAHYRRAHDPWQLCGALRLLAVARYPTGDREGAATALLEALDLAEAHGFNDRLEWVFRNVALLLPNESNDLARKLWCPMGEWMDEWWPEPLWDERQKWLVAECNDRPSPNAKELRAAIPLARDALKRMRANPREQGTA